MPITSVVLTLPEAEDQRARALQTLLSLQGVTLGAAAGARLPVVVETRTTADTDQMLHRLQDVDGMVCVQLVFSDFSDLVLEAPAATPPPAALGG